jgi:NAD(P)-dependent dehydrogenase (short-subunit alcohol dehydrogenase family)
VVVVDIGRVVAERTTEAISAEGGSAGIVVADVRHAADCARLVEEATTAFGPLDGVGLNVGIGRGAGLAGTDAGLDTLPDRAP